ncbi:MAG TPA: serine/threonine-protein kinase [Gemmatimonadaceae bacterium]|nr:serine/threonine-protein kinase [Gemmatimonadaceae bacterium]
MADLSLIAAIELCLGHGLTIERELGSGVMSSVYLARRGNGDGEQRERIVIKVMRLGTRGAQAEERFFREMRILRKLDHPRILPVLDVGEANGVLFFTMPYLQGKTLREWLHARATLPPRHALLVARDVVDALGHAHARGVVHRDVKPENILLAQEGAYLLDFGLAWAPGLTGDEAVTREARFIVGTPDYMSPEQVSGKHGEDWRGDFFSLGCVMYEMLTGRTPFGAGSARARMRRRLTETPADVRALRPGVPESVAAIISRALAVDPSGRFATAGLMRLAIDTALAALDPQPGDDAGITRG